MKILFQGDSITDAHRRQEEPNPSFRLGNGYAFLVAARLSTDYPDRDFTFLNRGISGHDTGDLLDRWKLDTLELAPDLLSLLIGINDVGKHFKGFRTTDPGRVEANYIRLLQQYLEVCPDGKLLLMEPFLLPSGDDRTHWQPMVTEVREIVRRLAKDHEATLVPLQDLFDQACRRAPASHWSCDGVHLTPAGFQLVADAWINAAKPILKLS